MTAKERMGEAEAEARLRTEWRRALNSVFERQLKLDRAKAEAEGKVDFVELDLSEESKAAAPPRELLVAELALPGGMVLRIFAPARLC